MNERLITKEIALSEGLEPDLVGSTEETRENNNQVSYLKYHNQWGRTPAANGKSHFFIDCPFCGSTVKAYVFSISGGGKKGCCGAMHSSRGDSRIWRDK